MKNWKKAIIPFITAGDTSLEMTKKLILSMQKNRADLIEIGIPFSDPIAEDITVQNANKRAFKAGFSVDKLFDTIKEIKDEIFIPLVFMTYINVIYTYGKDRFMKRCVECGISGIIVSDIPFEEKDELINICAKFHIALISSVSVSSNERTEMIAKEAEGFLCCVSTFDARSEINKIKTDIELMLKKVRNVSDIPCVLNFDISSMDRLKEVLSFFDGVIISSAIVGIIEKYKEECLPYIEKYIKDLGDIVKDYN